MCLGIPGKVIELCPEKVSEDQEVLMGRVDFGGVLRKVCMEHVQDAREGDYVLVHVGFALSKLNEEEARRVFEFLESMDQLDELGAPDEVS